MIKKYFKTGRISTGVGSFPLHRNNAFPLINEQQIQVVGIYASTDLASVYQAIDAAVNNGMWCVLMFHGLLPDEGVTMDVQRFKDIMDYLYKVNANVKTFSELTAERDVVGRSENKVNRKGYEDVEIADASKGVILTDRTNTNKYRIYIEGGIIKSEPVV